MKWGSRVDEINAWWKRVPRERYWLDATNRNDRDTLLAAPQGTGRGSRAWTHQLIKHVEDGDVVFHYEAGEQAIVAWSTAQGHVERKELSWPLPEGCAGEDVTHQIQPSWAIRLRQPTRLEAVVSLSEIARSQWELFPSLRALEDEVGDPLYYPFDMGNREVTRLLSGYLFKLPAILVQGVPALASAADRADEPTAEFGVDGFGASSPGSLAIRRGDHRDSQGQYRPGRRGAFADPRRILLGSE